MHPLYKAAWTIDEGERLPVSLAMLVSEELQSLWDECCDDIVMRQWLRVARVPAAWWIQCTEACHHPDCVACCDTIRRNFPVPPTLAELMAARSR